MKKIYVGAAYYPELWDESEVDKDIRRCKDLGVNCLRVGEFAWHTMEPREGEYHFEWLHKVLDKLAAADIAVVMCTPTCTPPRYLLNKYPEMLLTNADGKKSEVYCRCHICKSSEIARKKNAEIVTRMAQEFGKHTAVIGWQIDNEIFPYNDGCYCEHCIAGFRKYLENKFKTVENLNKAWCADRWSLTYSDFDEIIPPKANRWEHPSLYKAWWNFQCELINSYVAEQADIIRKYASVPVGTDMMQTVSLSYYDMHKNLDVVQFNHYNTAEELPHTAFSYDFLRCVLDKPFWVTETQVGWNGGTVAECGYRPEGNCYVNTVLPIARGAQMNMYWLFRAHRSGHELAHGALYSTAGREFRVADEVRQATELLNKCENFLCESEIKSDIALHYSTTAANVFTYAPLLKNFDYRNAVVRSFYSALGHYNVDVIDTPHSLDGYKVLISPFTANLTENGCLDRITEWVKSGGTWIVGPMSDIVDENISKYEDSPFSALEELGGVYLKYTKPIHNTEFKAKWTDGRDCEISTCFDAFEVKDKTESLAKYTVGEFAPLSVVTKRKVGKGNVIILGSVISGKDLLALINQKPIIEASENIILTKRTGRQNGIIVTEVQAKDGYIVLDGTYTDIATGKSFSGKVKVKPHGVLVLKSNG